MTADIAKGSLYMAAADKAAAAIESIINGQVADVIEQVLADGKITRAKAIELKKLGQHVGAHVVSLVLGLHSRYIDESKTADVDLPAPSDGTAELIAVINSMVSPLGGGR